ncbi:hypothetical protein [Stenotrophomonas sp.]|uniref:hypothetical protein n=1 Tax=Stenotrophomonas sp. TaxID=69392 RepID=UPI0028A9D99D|nr:hypothetical protein [Stenotrophomonas sp.]
MNNVPMNTASPPPAEKPSDDGPEKTQKNDGDRKEAAANDAPTEEEHKQQK